MTATIAAPVPAVRPAPLDRLPGTAADDPFLRLAVGWLLGHPTNTAKAYRRDLLVTILDGSAHAAGPPKARHR